MSDIEKPDVIGATRRAETIRIGMVGWAAAQDAIAEAFEAKDWITLGYKSWGEYVEKEFAEKRLKLTRDQRAEAVEVFRLVGMSQREIAATLAVGIGTVNRELNPSVPNGTPGAAQSEPPADPLDAIPAAKDAVVALLANRDAPADVPDEDHPAAPGDAAQDEVPVVPAESLGDETGPEVLAPRPASELVDLPQEQVTTGVSVPAPAGDPEYSGGSGERGQAAASVPAPPRTGETDEERAEREVREYREARSLEFATGLVNVRMRLEPDPVHWYQTVYIPGLYHARDLPRVRDSFTPTGLRQAAGFLLELADHLDEAGEEL